MAQLNWGMIGGGEGSQIGPAHRLGARLDGIYDFVAGALDHDPVAGRAYAQRLGVAPDRAYGDWREMLARHQAGQVCLIEGSDHALSDFEDHLLQILEFLQLV